MWMGLGLTYPSADIFENSEKNRNLAPNDDFLFQNWLLFFQCLYLLFHLLVLSKCKIAKEIHHSIDFSIGNCNYISSEPVAERTSICSALQQGMTTQPPTLWWGPAACLQECHFGNAFRPPRIFPIAGEERHSSASEQTQKVSSARSSENH